MTLVFEGIFHCFHVVIGGFFYFFDFESIVVGKVFIDGAQLRIERFIKVVQLWQWQFAEGNEVFNFNFHAIANQRSFREVSGQRFNFAAIAAVNGGNGIQGVHNYSSLFKKLYVSKTLSTLWLLLASMRAFAYMTLWVSVPKKSTHFFSR